MLARTVLRLAPKRRPIRLLTCGDQCVAAVERVLSSGHKSIAVDCEGTSLGRFGSLSLIQLATEDEVLLVDVLAGGARIVEPLEPLFSARELVKVFHDCREDVSLLTNQHRITVAGVFDTQVGHKVWLERQNLDTYQASVGEVLRTFDLATYRTHRWDDLERNPVSPHLWEHRPMEPNVIRYAVEGVAHLLGLQRKICRDLGDPAGDLVLRRSERYLEYAHLNRAELPMLDVSNVAAGMPVSAMLATSRSDSAYFKLNHSSMVGAVLDTVDLRDFKDLQPGDIVRCRIKSFSECRQFVHLQRDGHGALFFDYRQQEVRSLPSQEEVDAKRPLRQSTLYGFGQSGSSREAISERPRSFKQRKSEVFYKSGKRGQVGFRKEPELPRQKAKHMRFPVGGPET